MEIFEYITRSFDKFIDFIVKFWENNGGKIITALIIVLVGYILIKVILKTMKKILVKSPVSVSLHSFMLSAIKGVLWIVVFISAATSLGIDMASILTLLGAVGLAVSLAVKDSLANMAGGIMILFNRPFNVGEFIEAVGETGTVTEIGMNYTILNTPDNKKIFVPNGQLSNSTITNYSAEDIRRLDLVFSISYANDINKAKAVLLDIVNQNDLALKDPQPIIRVCAHSASSIDIATRVWVSKDLYWDLNFDMYEQVKEGFDKNNIEIPFNQLEVSVKKD